VPQSRIIAEQGFHQSRIITEQGCHQSGTIAEQGCHQLGRAVECKAWTPAGFCVTCNAPVKDVWVRLTWWYLGLKAPGSLCEMLHLFGLHSCVTMNAW